jgi:glycosyltransferase involved in cell wall biosynthesis
VKSTATVGPGPTRVLVVDLDQPLPEFTADDRYQSALVVGTRNDIPRGAVHVDLGPTAPAVADQLASLFTAVVGGTPDSSVPDAELPSITVVVPTIVGRHEDLQLLLDGFAHVDYPHVDFLLVDNRSTLPDHDPLPGLMAGRSRIRVIREVRPGISAARNAGITAATGEIVAFTDDDVLVEPGWLRAIGSRFTTEPALDAVTGLILPAEMETSAQIWFERYYGGFSGERTFAPLTLQAAPGPKWLRGSRTIVRDAAGNHVREFAVYGAGAYGAGANMAFRRSTLLKLGGFDLALGTGTPSRGGEDLAMLIQILWSGGVLGYEPAAVAHHRHRREVEELLHQLRGNGLGFTAMLTSLILADRRHLLGLGYQLPLAGWRMLRQSLARIRGKKVGAAGPGDNASAELYPRELVVNELRGYPKGPLAYLRSRKQMKAWTPPRASRPPARS